MATAAVRRIPPPRIYASIDKRRSTTEIKQPTIYDSEIDHEKCRMEENELREVNRRQLLRIELLERDYRQLDDDVAQLQNERDILLKQKRVLEDELGRSSYHASANVDLHVYTQQLENDCRELRCQLEVREKEKFEFNEIISELEVQIKEANEQKEQWRDANNSLETMLTTETEHRQCLEMQLKEVNLRQKENENQIRSLQNNLDEIISSKQEILKANYILVQNAEELREQLRTIRTQAAESRIISTSSSVSFDNLDESIPYFISNDNDDDIRNLDKIDDQSDNCQSSLFNEINSLETISNETISTCLNGAMDDIEIDLLLAKTTTLSSTLSLINQLMNEIKYFLDFKHDENCFGQNNERVLNMKVILKRIFDNTQLFDKRFKKLQLLLIASRDKQQCHQAEIEDLFRLVDKRFISNVDQSWDNSTNQQHRLVSILEAYQSEIDRLSQIIRTNDDTIRSYERQLTEQQNLVGRCRIKTTFLEKNQRKLIDKIKELNNERRHLLELTTQKRTRRRVSPMVQVEIQQKPKPSAIFATPPKPIAGLRRARSLPHIRPLLDGRKSRNDSGVVLNDEFLNNQPISVIHNRRRIKTNATNQLVVHTSSHVCYQKQTISIHSNSKNLKHNSYRYYWFFLIFFLFILILLYTFMQYDCFQSII